MPGAAAGRDQGRKPKKLASQEDQLMGEALRRLLGLCGKSAAAVARATGEDANTIRRFLRGEQAMRRQKLARILAELNKSFADLDALAFNVLRERRAGDEAAQEKGPEAAPPPTKYSTATSRQADVHEPGAPGYGPSLDELRATREFLLSLGRHFRIAADAVEEKLVRQLGVRTSRTR